MVRKGNHETRCAFPCGSHSGRNRVRDHCGNAATTDYIYEGEPLHYAAHPAAAQSAAATGPHSAETSAAYTSANE